MENPIDPVGLNLYSQDISELAKALALAQREIKSAPKQRVNPYFKSYYADLASCWDACREALAKNGLAVVQATWPIQGSLWLVTTLIHNSGQWMRSLTPIRCKDDSPQVMGSAITYARRYALCAIAGVASEDDDGQRALQGRSTENAVVGRSQPAYGPQIEPQKPQGVAHARPNPVNAAQNGLGQNTYRQTGPQPSGGLQVRQISTTPGNPVTPALSEIPSPR